MEEERGGGVESEVFFLEGGVAAIFDLVHYSGVVLVVSSSHVQQFTLTR